MIVRVGNVRGDLILPNKPLISVVHTIKTKGGVLMYSPKIDAQLIPLLYRMAKSRGMPMTMLVNQVVSRFIKREKNNIYINQKGGCKNDSSRSYS